MLSILLLELYTLMSCECYIQNKIILHKLKNYVLRQNLPIIFSGCISEQEITCDL